MPKPRIPGTLRELNKEVQRVMLNETLSRKQRSEIAAGLITAKVLAAHRIG